MDRHEEIKESYKQLGGKYANIYDGMITYTAPVGTGVLTMPMYRKLPDADITCMDYSQDMMDNAAKGRKRS